MPETLVMDEIAAGFEDGLVIPYLGPGMVALEGDHCHIPASPEALVAKLTVKSSVPPKLRANLTGAAQFIENFKHRKTLKTGMTEAFRSLMPPTPLHEYLAQVPSLPLMVHAWYDDIPQKALEARDDWGMVQGVSQAEHFGQWVHYYTPDGSNGADEVEDWTTLLYQPIGSVFPAENYLVSDSDYVEVLTEIDIQTPIPVQVQRLRTGRHFLFLGCRFNTQLDRMFARQIMKRSSDRHWAVLPEEPTRNELRFMDQQHIQRIELPLTEFVGAVQRLAVAR